MSSRYKKQSKKESLNSKPESQLLTTVRFVVSIYRGYLRLHFWSMIVLLIIIMIIGDLLTQSGFLLVLGIITYFLLFYLDKWLERYEKK